MLEGDKYWTKNIGLSASDSENEISVFEVKEMLRVTQGMAMTKCWLLKNF